MSKTFTIEKGRVVKVNGLPYECLGDVQVSGWREPEWPVGPLTGPASGSANAPDQPPAAETPGEPATPNRRSVASDGSAVLDPNASIAEVLGIDPSDDAQVLAVMDKHVGRFNRDLEAFVAAHPGSEILRDVFFDPPKSLEDARQFLQSSVGCLSDSMGRIGV